MRLRTIDGAYKEIRSQDEHTAITKYRIRELVINGEIPARKSGKKWLIDLDDLFKYYGEGVSS